MIDPNIWHSEDFSKLSALAKLIFIGIFSNADDQGRGRAKSAYLKSVLFPYDENLRVSDVDKALSEISKHMSISFYELDGNEYYLLDNWDKWQRVDRPTPSVIPPPDERCKPLRGSFVEPSPNPRRALDPNIIEEKLSKDKLVKENKARISSNNEIPDKKVKFAEFVSMTRQEYQALQQKLGDERLKKYLEALDNYKGSTGKKYKSDYRTILAWIAKEQEDSGSKGGNDENNKRNAPPKYGELVI